MCVFSKINEQEAMDFFEKLLTGVDLKKGMPETALRTRLIRAGAGVARLPREIQLGLTIKAWNAKRSGKVMELVKIHSTEAFPSPI